MFLYDFYLMRSTCYTDKHYHNIVIILKAKANIKLNPIFPSKKYLNFIKNNETCYIL